MHLRAVDRDHSDLDQPGFRAQRQHLSEQRRGTVEWHGTVLNCPDWSEHSHSLAFTAELKADRLMVHFIFNAYWQPLTFELPPAAGSPSAPWRRWIDTALDSPEDIVPWQDAPPLRDHRYRADARSVVVLFAPLA